MTFFVHTAVEIAIGEVRKLLRIGGVGDFNIVVLAVAGSLFGLYGSERADELFMSPPTPHPPPPSPPFTVPNKLFFFFFFNIFVFLYSYFGRKALCLLTSPE